MKQYAKSLSLGFIALLSIVLFVPVVTAQDSNYEDSNANPYIAIFYDHPSVLNDTVLYTDGENVTVSLSVFMHNINSMFVMANNVNSVWYKASWEKDQKIVLYNSSDWMGHGLTVPIGNQHIEVYATGIVKILGFENGKEVVRTAYGNNTLFLNFTVAHPTPTPSNTPVNPQGMYDQNLLLLMAIVTILSFALAGIVLFFRSHRNTAEKPN